MNISKHFTLEELTFSDYAVRNGVDNTPSQEVIHNLVELCGNVLEPLRDIVKKPIVILSGYRSVPVNTGIGGADNSQHVQGKAADIRVPEMTINELFEIASKYVNYDQVIHEFGRWVHISWSLPLRKEKFYATKENGKTIYTLV